METAGYSSGLYMNSNNPWGMKFPTVRATTSSGKVYGTAGRYLSDWREYLEAPNIALKNRFSSTNDFARYSTLADGVKDILLYMDALSYPTSTTDLLSFIQLMKQKKYFGEEDVQDYFNKVKAWLDR